VNWIRVGYGLTRK